MRSLAACVMAIALLAGCAAPPSPVAGTPPACTQPGENRMLQADLLFGRDITGRGPVTDAERAAFLADTVTHGSPTASPTGTHTASGATRQAAGSRAKTAS